MAPQHATWRQYWETVRRLEPEQLLFQVWRPLQPYLWPPPRAGSAAMRVRADWGWETSRPHVAADAAVLQGTFRFWGVTRTLDLETEWGAADLGDSWNFPVHYFDAFAALATAADRTPERDAALRDHLLRWIELHDVPRGIAWHPYPTSLRIVNWLDALAVLREGAEPAWTEAVLESVSQQLLSIPPQMERHLLGTHLLKNLKAILIGAAVFEGVQMHAHRNKALRLLARELQAQVHADGGHLEPSAMYHCMATGDLLDLLNFKGALPPDAADATRQVVTRMLTYATIIEAPGGGYPLQGDAWQGGEWTPAQLCAYAARLGLEVPAAPGGLTFLPDSGVAVWRSRTQWLFADVAPVGPPHLPGHGHCDALSFEWSVDGVPLIVDAGTFSYEEGLLRHECRSTASHNTLQIDGHEWHEIWSRFRVARRSAVQAHQIDAQTLEAVLHPWFAPRMVVCRRFHFTRDEIHIEDRVDGTGDHDIVSRLHLHPRCAVQQTGEHTVRLEHDGVHAELLWEGGELDVLSSGTSGSRMAVEAGCPMANPVVLLHHRAALPFASRLVLRAQGRKAS